MSLPKIAHSKFKVTLASNGKEIELRPFLVKEEKILLVAMESREDKEISEAITNIIQSCILTPDVDVRKLPSFDVEMIFLKLRMKSVGEVLELQLRHRENIGCDHAQKVVVNLEKVQMVIPPEHNKVIKITSDIGVNMKYPTQETIEHINGQNVEGLFTLIASSIGSVFTNDEVHAAFTDKEIQEWVENLNEEQLQKIMVFFNTMPHVAYTVKYKCDKCGTEEVINLRGLKDFFT